MREMAVRSQAVGQAGFGCEIDIYQVANAPRV